MLERFSGDGEWILLGLMSGTSLDALDAARLRVRTEGGEIRRWELIDARERPLGEPLRGALESLIRGGKTDAAGFARLHVDFARACAEFVLAEFPPLREECVADLAAFPGQTLWHDPGGAGLSFQIGSPAAFATLTGIPSVGEFRLPDVLRGGEGAPLVPLADALLFRSPDESRALLNLGGIANLTLLPAGRGTESVRGWDTGPGNTLLDAATRLATGAPFDAGGRLASAGRVSEKHLRAWLSHPWFSQAPPRSTGRELFGGSFLGPQQLGDLLAELGAEDLLATLAELTLRPIIAGLSASDVQKVYVAGGGAENAHLMARLREGLAPLPVASSEELGLPPKLREAACFAVLALEAAAGRPVALPGVTGARAASGAGLFAAGA